MQTICDTEEVFAAHGFGSLASSSRATLRCEGVHRDSTVETRSQAARVGVWRPPALIPVAARRPCLRERSK